MQSHLLGFIKQMTAPNHRNLEDSEVSALHRIGCLQVQASKFPGRHFFIHKTKALAEAEPVGNCPISHLITGSIARVPKQGVSNIS